MKWSFGKFYEKLAECWKFVFFIWVKLLIVRSIDNFFKGSFFFFCMIFLDEVYCFFFI